MNIKIDDIKKIIDGSGVAVDVENIDADIDLSEQGVDSLDMANIYLAIEEELGVKVLDEDIDTLTSITTIISYVNNKK